VKPSPSLPVVATAMTLIWTVFAVHYGLVGRVGLATFWAVMVGVTLTMAVVEWRRYRRWLTDWRRESSYCQICRTRHRQASDGGQ
jgi:hypothetical protein